MSERKEPLTVLFVDDEDAILRAIVRIFGRVPFRVLTANRATAALDVLAEHRVDVIVSDIDMPEMNGLELLAVVRERYPSVLRMLLTGAATLDRALHAINEGEVVRFFQKPFDVEGFKASIEALVDRVERNRRDDAETSRRTRQAELQRWLDRRYPGLLDIARTDEGEVSVDLDGLRRTLLAAGVPALAALFRE